MTDSETRLRAYRFTLDPPAQLELLTQHARRSTPAQHGGPTTTRSRSWILSAPAGTMAVDEGGAVAHTTNTPGTFTSVAPDCPATTAEVPPERATPSVARLQYDMLVDAPYVHTSDDVVFAS